jgi:ribonuclease P protein component
MTASPRNTFPRGLRLSGQRAFAAVFDARMRKSLGTLVVVSRPNALPHNRLGLSVPRKVGTAVARHRIKRMLREAFRLEQHNLPQGYDVVLVVRPHEVRPLTDYRRLLVQGFDALDAAWRKRRAAGT